MACYEATRRNRPPDSILSSTHGIWHNYKMRCSARSMKPATPGERFDTGVERKPMLTLTGRVIGSRCATLVAIWMTEVSWAAL